jgi:hypothetical protein
MSFIGMAGEPLYVRQQLENFRATGDCRTPAEKAAQLAVGYQISRVDQIIYELSGVVREYVTQSDDTSSMSGEDYEQGGVYL